MNKKRIFNKIINKRNNNKKLWNKKNITKSKLLLA